jgi:ATP-dependent Lhr-like helicase
LERLRTVREPESGAPSVHLLAATDPAQPYGAALAWPRRGEDDRRPLQRAAGAYVVMVDGAAAAYLERGGASVQLLPAADDQDTLRRAVAGLRTLVADGRVRELVIKRVDGEPVSSSVRRDDLLEAGFVPGYRGLTLRRA